MVNQAIEKTELMAIEEFVRLYDTEGPFELIEGEIKPVSPTVAGHSDAAKILYDAMLLNDPQQINGSAYFDVPFVLTASSDWVKGSRIPDVMFFKADRLAQYKAEHADWKQKPFVLVPDLVVEIVSTNDNYTDVDKKVDLYLDDGVELVLVVDPRQKTITLRRQDEYKKLRVGDTLTLDDITPGFEIAVAKVFE